MSTAPPAPVSVNGVSSRARLAQGALAVTLALDVLGIAALGWCASLLQSLQRGDETARPGLETARSLETLGALGSALMLLATGVLFLRWVHGLVAATRALGNERLRWRPADAVWAFIIPIISLVRPYQVLRDVHDALEPDAVAPPAPRVTAGERDGYRGVTVVEPAAPPRLPPAFIGLWWAAFVASRFAGQGGSIAPDANAAQVASGFRSVTIVHALSIVAAMCAIVVVRGVTARLVERHRRLAWAAGSTTAG